jgi:membrane protease YdiL (CAAX protease family)
MTTVQQPRDDQTFRVRPAVWIGLAVYVGYVLLFSGVGKASGVDYDDLGDTAGNLFRGADVALIIGTILLAVTTSLLGWWRPALFEQHRSRARWPIIAPILMGVALVFNLVGTDWGSYDGAFFAASLPLLLVGFTEEITTRGLLLTGLRSRLGEGWVWFLTAALFGLLHLPNAYLGQAMGPTLQQIVFAFLAGTVFYILRRVTGTLIWAMVLHALWDFSTFASGHGAPSPFAGLSVIAQIPAFALALIAVAFVIRGAAERTDRTDTVSTAHP